MSARAIGRPRRRTARVRGTWAASGISHLDLENLIVALLAEKGDTWPNALYELGYRLHCFDTTLALLEAQGDNRVGCREFAPDAIAIEKRKNRALVFEAKIGPDVGLKQVPEGLRIPIDEWARAIGMRVEALFPPTVQGVLVAPLAVMESKLDLLTEKRVTLLRVSESFEVDPCFLSDERVKPALEALPASEWPRSFVPFGRDPSQNPAKRVVAALAPRILAAARRGEDRILAVDLAMATHEAVWKLADAGTKKGWATIVGGTLKEASAGSLKRIATYVPSPPSLHLQDIVPGRPPGERYMQELKAALEREQRRRPRRGAQVPIRRAIGAIPMNLWPDSD